MEAAARALRHRFLARTAIRFKSHGIALAHHAGDQAETVLIRLFRGAGGFGLEAMTATARSPANASVALLRPLLNRTRAELESLAREQHWDWREDSSNADSKILRNRIRNELLPLLRRQYCPAIDTLLCRTAEITAADARLSSSSALQWLDSKRRPPFPKLPLAIQRAVIRNQIQSLGGSAQFELTERLRIEPEVPVEVSPGRRIQRRLDGTVVDVSLPVLDHCDRARDVDFAGRGGRFQFGGRPIRWRIGVGNQVPSSQRGIEHFDADRVGPVVRVRHWQAGDRFRPLGFLTAAKLQNLFVNRKVPAAGRRHRIVATTASGEIFWVEGLPPGEQFKIRLGTCRILTLTWQVAVAESAGPIGETEFSAVFPTGDTPSYFSASKSGAKGQDQTRARPVRKPRRVDS